MTEKVIIDGVNVAGCCNLDEWKHCNICQELIKTIPNRHQCLIEEELRCEFYRNCYYKQLKRLEQENKELKISNSNLDSQLHRTNEMLNNCNNRLQNYHSALEEIREDMKQDTTCESRECGCDDYAECLNCIKETILTKINEVLNE